MTDQNYGAYISVRTPSGLLVSSSRETLAEAITDMRAFFGDEGWDRIKSVAQVDVSAGGGHPVGFVGGGGNGSPPPAVAVSGDPALEGGPEATPSPTPDRAELVEQQAEELAQELGAQQFESCRKCGSIKDRWVPPGVSKAGKKYAGFWGCSNRNCR